MAQALRNVAIQKHNLSLSLLKNMNTRSVVTVVNRNQIPAPVSTGTVTSTNHLSRPRNMKQVEVVVVPVQKSLSQYLRKCSSHPNLSTQSNWQCLAKRNPSACLLSVQNMQLQSRCAYTCKCPCPADCLPPPCNTPPKCLFNMTGYYYYPYGTWFCGPYHQSVACPCPCPCTCGVVNTDAISGKGQGSGVKPNTLASYACGAPRGGPTYQRVDYTRIRDATQYPKTKATQGKKGASQPEPVFAVFKPFRAVQRPTTSSRIVDAVIQKPKASYTPVPEVQNPPPASPQIAQPTSAVLAARTQSQQSPPPSSNNPSTFTHIVTNPAPIADTDKEVIETDTQGNRADKPAVQTDAKSPTEPSSDSPSTAKTGPDSPKPDAPKPPKPFNKFFPFS